MSKIEKIVRFRWDGSGWRCEDSQQDVLGDVVCSMTTGEWRFLSLGSVLLDRQMCRDIADFLDQLNKKGLK